jgi:hypothetical protein
MMLPPPTGFGRWGHATTGVAVAARHCCVTDSCAAAGAIASVLNMTGRSADAMVMPPDIEVQILRYYHAEKWTVGTISRQLHVHHSVVRRVLAQAGLLRIGAAQRPSPIDAYLEVRHRTGRIARFVARIGNDDLRVAHHSEASPPVWGGHLQAAAR